MTSLRVLQADGKPAAGAVVRVVEVKLKAPRPPDKLLDFLAGKTDAEGRLTMGGIAHEDIFALDVTVDGQVVQSLPIDDDRTTVSLRPLGRFKVRVVADDPKALSGWTVTAWSRPMEPGYKGTYTTLQAISAATVGS